jgi:hypothetical protein
MLARLLIGFGVICCAGRLVLGDAAANEIRMHGITFSAASDNMRLLGGTGSGTLEDPFILREEIVEEGDAILRIRVENPDFGSRVGTLHAVGFVLHKQVVNSTDRAWEYFSMELEFRVGEGSDYFDGLSFGQSTQVNRPFKSNVFSAVEDVTEPRDMIRFSDGRAAPGQLAEFQIAITHTGPTPHFYLVQHLRHPFADLETETWLAARAPREAPGLNTP